MRRPQILIVSTLLLLPAGAALSQGKGEATGNGIAVSAPKLFDERTLYARLQNMQNALLSMSTFYNQSQLASAIGSLQGANATVSQQQINATLQLPTTAFNSVQTATTPAATGAGATSGLNSNTTTPPTATSTNTVNQAAPTIPPLQTLSVASGLTPLSNVALAPSSLLAQQTAFNYQLVNLSLLLDRSVSDRILHSHSTSSTSNNYVNSHSRLQAVIGLNISVLPKYQDAVAEVEVVFTEPKNHEREDELLGQDESVSDGNLDDNRAAIVALLPQENTYNVASYTNSTAGFSVGTVFQFMGLSGAASRSSAGLYIAQDIDTVAFQRSSPTLSQDKALRFGWQFRPVLNRHVIDAGTRQVFAVLSLPVPDDRDLDKTKHPYYKGQVEIHTIWRKYDRNKHIVGAPIGKPECIPLGALNIYSSSVTEDALSPFVNDVEMIDVGNGNMEEVVKGRNFYPGSSIVYNGVPGPPGSFQLQSEHQLHFVVPAAALLHSAPAIVGPYGDRYAIEPSYDWKSHWNLYVNNDKTKSYVTSHDSLTSRVHLTVSLDKAKPVERKDYKWYGGPNLLRLHLQYKTEDWTSHIVATVGAQMFGLSDQPFLVIPSGNDDEVIIEFDVPTALLRTARKIVIQPLIANSGCEAQFTSLGSDFVVSTALVVPVDADSVDVVLLGVNLNGEETKDFPVSVSANGVVLRGDSPDRNREQTNHLLRFRMSRDEARGLTNVVVYRSDQAAQTIAVQAPVPGVVTLSTDTLNIGEDLMVTVKGDNLLRIIGVQFDGAPLTWSYDPVKKTGSLHITKDVTDKAAKRTLIFALDDGTFMPLTLTVTDPAATAKTATSTTPATPVPVIVATPEVIARKDVNLQVIGSNLDQIVKAAIVKPTSKDDPTKPKEDVADTPLTFLYDPATKNGELRLKAEMLPKAEMLTVVFHLKDNRVVVHGIVIKEPPKVKPAAHSGP